MTTVSFPVLQQCTFLCTRFRLRQCVGVCVVAPCYRCLSVSGTRTKAAGSSKFTDTSVQWVTQRDECRPCSVGVGPRWSPVCVCVDARRCRTSWRLVNSGGRGFPSLSQSARFTWVQAGLLIRVLKRRREVMEGGEWHHRGSVAFSLIFSLNTTEAHSQSF